MWYTYLYTLKESSWLKQVWVKTTSVKLELFTITYTSWKDFIQQTSIELLLPIAINFMHCIFLSDWFGCLHIHPADPCQPWALCRQWLAEEAFWRTRVESWSYSRYWWGHNCCQPRWGLWYRPDWGLEKGDSLNHRNNHFQHRKTHVQWSLITSRAGAPPLVSSHFIIGSCKCPDVVFQWSMSNAYPIYVRRSNRTVAWIVIIEGICCALLVGSNPSTNPQVMSTISRISNLWVLRHPDHPPDYMYSIAVWSLFR